MGVEQRDAPMLLAQPPDLFAKRRVVRIEVETSSVCNVGCVWGQACAIERLAVERGRRDEFCRGLTGIERGAARIAIDVDDRARKPRAHHSRAERRDKIVKPIKPPIGVFAGEPRTYESRVESEEIRPRVGNADDERRVAALDDEPIGAFGHRAGVSSPGSAAAPTASMMALPPTRLVARVMSG